MEGKKRQIQYLQTTLINGPYDNLGKKIKALYKIYAWPKDSILFKSRK